MWPWLRRILRWLAKLPGLSAFGLSSVSADAEPTLLTSNPQNSLITWDGKSFVTDDNLIHLSEDGVKTSSIPTVSKWDSPLAPLGADVLYVRGGSPTKIYRVTESGSDTLYIDTGVSLSPKALRTDNTGRVYLFSSSGATLRRWNADTTFDQTFTLAYTLNTTANGSADGAPASSACGLDISPDGRYVYVVSTRTDASADLTTPGYVSNVTIYRFDLDEGATPTPTVWVQYPYQRYLPPLSGGSLYSAFSKFISQPFGLAVSPDGTKVAIEVKVLDHETQHVVDTSTGRYITYSYLKNYLDVRDSGGTPISRQFLADDLLDLSFGSGGNTPFYYDVTFSSTSLLEPPMVWDPRSTAPFFWVNEVRVLDNGGAGGSARIARYACLFEGNALKKYNVWGASYTFGSVSSFANWAPYLIFSGQTFPGEGRRTAAEGAGGTYAWGPELP